MAKISVAVNSCVTKRQDIIQIIKYHFIKYYYILDLSWNVWLSRYIIEKENNISEVREWRKDEEEIKRNRKGKRYFHVLKFSITTM